MTWRKPFLLLFALLLAGCASLGMRDALRVSVAGMESIPGEGMEARFMLKLRVQNPNNQTIQFNGVAIDLDVQGQEFASGVSSLNSSIPAYGESVIEVPVTVPAIAVLRQIITLKSRRNASIDYRLRGKLGGGTLTAIRFDSTGELNLKYLRL